MQNGIVYPLAPLVRLTRETGFGLWHTPLASQPNPAYEKRAPKGKVRKYPIPNLAAEVQEGIPYSVKSALRKLNYPTPCANTRPNEGNVRLLRAKVLACHLTRQEATGMLGGKDPFEAQGSIPAMRFPREKFLPRLDFSGKHSSNPNGGQLNPMWVEWLMGYPEGWTDLSS